MFEDGVIYQDGVPILKQDEIRIPGIHNVENYMAAICAVKGFVPGRCICEVARDFGGVEHRIELVREKGGVSYYNDSIASSPSRTIAGLRSFSQKVILIAGGYDKKIPYDVLGPEICAHVKTLVLTGMTAEKIKKATQNAAQEAGVCPKILEEPDFYKAIRLAASTAEAGDIVLCLRQALPLIAFKTLQSVGMRSKKR